jgi:Tol biopolymer transport system component
VISPGTRLGPYEILATLGAGGMGEVYRARDTRLGREVAVKVISPAIAGNAEQLRRFEREARSASALSDPHIVTVFDVGEQDGIHYFASELVEGGDLRSRLEDGRLPVRKAIEIAEQIASGLASAHEKGITHRDLKPENILLTKAGLAKIADFGLAKLAETPDVELSRMPTSDRIETTAGTVMGTVSYMSPEQASGRKVDYRSDQFSFGVIVYEMLTGRLAFRKDTPGETLAAILRDDPTPMANVNPAVPAPVSWTVDRCLAKDPEERYASTRDLAREIAGLRGRLSETSSKGRAIEPAGTPRGRGGIVWALAGAAAMAALGFVVSRLRPPAVAPRAVRFQIEAPPRATSNVIGRDAGPLAISPDGGQIAFVATSADGQKQIYLRALNALDARPLSGTDGASYPFWSPDSRAIGFFAGGKLKKIAASGGPVQSLCDAVLARGGTWNRDGVIVFSPGAYDPLYRVPASGGTPVPVTRFVDPLHENSHRWPQFLPDGRHFLFLRFAPNYSPSRPEDAICLGSLDSMTATEVVSARSSFAYTPSGQLLYVRDDTLMAVPFDAKRGQVTGPTVPIAQRVLLYRNTANSAFSVSDNGVLVYHSGPLPPVSELDWFDRGGKLLGSVGEPGDYEDPRLSPDARRLATNRIDPASGASSIWIFDMAGGGGTRFTFSQSVNHYPVWSPDGSRIAFDTNRNGPSDIFMKSFDGSGEERPVLASEVAKSPTDWSPDGSTLVFERLDPRTKYDLWRLSLKAGATPEPIVRSDAGETDGRISPDGKWLAYASNESGIWEVYVTAFPGPGGRWQVSNGGGVQPVWSRSGKEIFFLAGDRKLMAAPCETSPTFAVGAPKPLFQTLARYTGNVAYDVAPDGRFLVNTIAGAGAAPPITVVMNWEAALKK